MAGRAPSVRGHPRGGGPRHLGLLRPALRHHGRGIAGGAPPARRPLGERLAGRRAPGVGATLAEPRAPTALMARVAAETGARVITLAPSVGAEPEARDYLALFDFNVERLAAGLAR